MKRIMSKVVGAFIAGSMVLSALPNVVSADEVDAKPVDYDQTYENGSWIDFGDGALICGFGESDEDVQEVEGVLQIAYYEFNYDDDVEIEEELEYGNVTVCLLDSNQDVVTSFVIYIVSEEDITDDLVFGTYGSGEMDYLDDPYVFDILDIMVDTSDEDDEDDEDIDDEDDVVEEVDDVTAVSEMIDALPDPEDVTLDYYEAIYEAYDAYYNLDDEQKADVKPELVEKLDADMIAITRAFIDFYTELANELLADYGDIISDDAKTGLESNLEYSKKVYDDESSSLFTLEEALDNLYYACKTADKELDDIYEFVEGAEASWKKGGKDPFKVRASQKGLSDDAYDSFIAAGSVVIVDETQLTGDQFTASEGSVIIEIIPEFLETLSVGEHTLTIKFENNVSVTTKFTIEAAADVPASGESVSPAVYVGVAMVLLAGAGFVVNKRLGKKES